MSAFSFPIHLIDDDLAYVKALSRLLRLSGFEVLAYSSATDFMNRREGAIPGCIVLDMAMPGPSGLELQEWLTSSGTGWPVIFVSGKSDIPISVRAMKAGAVDFLTKPVEEAALLRAIRLAMDREGERRGREIEINNIRTRLATLTEREREVLGHVVSGQLNKQIASDLGTVEVTIKVHRARIMRKMAAESLASLVRMTERAGIGSHDSSSASAS